MTDVTTVVPPVRPDVFVDFSVHRGLLFVSVRNIGAASAYDVRTMFDQPFRGLGGRTDCSALALFHALRFLPPGKRIRHLVDTAGAYFQRKEPLHLTATLTYADREGRQFTDVIPHNLEVYRDLAAPLYADTPRVARG